MNRASCIDNNALRDGLYFVPLHGTLLVDELAASVTIALAALCAEDGCCLFLTELAQLHFFAFFHGVFFFAAI